jgi:CRP-like cAMP-binding protein
MAYDHVDPRHADRRDQGDPSMSKDSYHDYLKQVPLFADLDRAELDRVAQAATDLDLDAGNVLMREGTMANEMVVLVEGLLEVTRDGEHIADIGPGGFAGEMALLTHSHRNSTVTTKTACSVLHIDGRAFNALLAEVPEIAVKMLPVVASRVTANSSHHSD